MPKEAKVGIALLGCGSHQFTQSDVTRAGGALLFESVTNPDNSESALALAKLATRQQGVEVVSIMFSPISIRVDAATVALESGCHVILERPAGFTPNHISRLDAAAKSAGVRYWERATTAFEEPFTRVQEILESSVLGDIVLTTFHRSYPWASWRPEDEAETGGLMLQSASYGLDFICQLTKKQITQIRVSETTFGEPEHRKLRMAGILIAELEDSSIASISVDYLNPSSNPWSREEIRFLGTNGRLDIDSTVGTLTVINQEGAASEKFNKGQSRMLSEIFTAIREGGDTLPSSESLLQPTKILVEARASSNTGWHSLMRKE
jgi:predicted dehydrogenase